MATAKKKTPKPNGDARRRDLDRLRARLEETEARLQEAQETLRAIRSGEVDALVVSSSEGDRIFTLQGADQAYRTLVERMNEGAATLTPDGSVLYCNQRLAQMLGRPLERVIGSSVAAMVAPDDRPLLYALLRQAAAGGDGRGEVSLHAADGAHLPAYVSVGGLDLGGTPALGMVVTDLSERKRAEQILASERFTRQLIDSTPIGVAVVGRDSRYILANPAYQAITGDAAAPIAGRTIAEVFPPPVARIVQSSVEQVFQSGRPLPIPEYEVNFGPGRERTWWNVHEVPLREAAGNVEAVLILTQEVTERKRAEEELKAAKVSAEQAKAAAEAANAAKDHFLAVLSHELRTPLTPVLTTAQMLETEADLTPDVRESVQIIRRNVELEARLIDDLLDLTRITRGKLELQLQPVDAHEQLQQAAAMCEAEARSKRQALALELKAAPSLIHADPGRFQQMVWNLLKNAVKFTPAGGRVTVRTRNVDGSQLAVEVIDNGVGIEPEVLPRLFNAFEQGGRSTTRQFGGLGLGLAISKALADAHGGMLSAHSAGRGRGATFTLRLPLSHASAAAGAPSQLKTSTAPGHGRQQSARQARLLLVEDHADTAKAMSRVLRARGYQVTIAETVAAAVQAAGAASFDLLISDLGLPDGSGLDLMRQLKAQGRSLPAIALSGFGMEEDLRRSKEVGFLEHLTKPVDLKRLQATLVRLIAV